MNNPDFSNKTILIVEDDEMSARFLIDLFEDTNAKTLHVVNVSDAIYAVHENKSIDLILMDIQLPDMNGWQATRIIKKVKKNMPIIIQSAYSFDSYIKKSMDAGCDFFIAKPINPDILFNNIEQAFEKYQ
jgi:CheY-like chemotaxis protein